MTAVFTLHLGRDANPLGVTPCASCQQGPEGSATLSLPMVAFSARKGNAGALGEVRPNSLADFRSGCQAYHQLECFLKGNSDRQIPRVQSCYGEDYYACLLAWQCSEGKSLALKRGTGERKATNTLFPPVTVPH